MILRINLPKFPEIAGLLLLLFLFLTINLQAQYRITGSITDDADGSPLIGVNVYEVGQPTRGTITDLDGNFELDVTSLESSLVASYVGFSDQEIAIKGRNIIDFVMSAGVALDEVVVTALGIEREEKALGYSVQTVESDAINNVRAGNNMLNSLTGKVAGLQTTASSNGLTSSSRLVIRGESSLNINDNSPFNCR